MSDLQTDREERQHVIEVLQNMADWMEAAHYIVAKPERRHALDYAISSIKTDLKYDLLYEKTSEHKEPTTEACETCRYYGSHHGVCDYCYKCSLWTEKEPNKSEISAGSTTKNDDLALIRTWGLDEEIRCTMCTNSMKSDRGCDGSCVVNKDMYKAVMDAIEKRIQSTTKNDCETCIHNKGVLECDMYGCKYEPTAKNDLAVDAVSRQAINGYIDYILSHGMGKKKSFDFIKKFVAKLPPVTPQEPRKGHWIFDYISADGHRTYHCSECGCFLKPKHSEPLNSFKWCSLCGADMRGEE